MYLEPVSQPPDSPLEEKSSLWHKILAVAIYLLAWIALTASGLWLMFELRALVVELMIFGNLNPWAVRGYDRVAIFVLGLIWFIALMWIEHYLRTGLDKKRLWHNIGRVAAIQAILVAIIFATRFLINL